MITLLKNKFFSLFGILLIATLVVSCITIWHNKPQQNLGKDLISPDQFRNHVDLLMTNTWEQLEQDAAISLSKCKNYLQAIGTQYKESRIKAQIRKAKKNRTIEPKTKALIQEILIDFNIDPRTITLVSYDGHGSPASTDDFTLYVDEQDLARYSPEAQRFVIAHEISHIKNKDHSCETAIRSLMNHKDQTHKQCLHSFAHSIEFRADINAMLKSSKYAKGGIAFFHELIDRYGDEDCPTHPQSSDRLKIAQEIQEMHMQKAQLRNSGILTA